VSLQSIPEAPAVDPASAQESQGLFVSQDPEIEVEYNRHQTRETRTRSNRKRATPPVEYEPEKQAEVVEEEEDLVDKLAPTAAALKRRRLAEQTARRRRGESSPPPEPVRESPEPELEAPKKVKKEFDILELARTKREEAEELARKEREALQEALDGMDIEAIRNLAIIEEIGISRQPPPQRASREDESDRWDDRWNGRKNFKKFRRRGEAGGRGREFHRVIVPLEEVKKKDFGIGDDYWLETDNQRRNKKDRGQGSQDMITSQSIRQTGASSRASETVPHELDDEPESDADVVVSSDIEVLEEPPPLARTSRSQRKSQKTAASAAPSQTRAAAANNKRPAPASFAKPAPAKKTRQASARRKDDSDDSDDELKFRFRR
jgi:nijmegen breakage syndrome protein 1